MGKNKIGRREMYFKMWIRFSWLTKISDCMLCLNNVKVILSIHIRAVIRYLHMTELRAFATVTFTSRHGEDLNVVLLGYESWREVCVMKSAFNRNGWRVFAFGVSSECWLRFFRNFPQFVKPIYGTV